jgi:excisionase family DNA binding protein
VAKEQKGRRVAKGAGGAMDLIGTAEAAGELGVSEPTLRRWLKDGRVQAHKVGKQWRLRRSDLGSLVRAQVEESGSWVPLERSVAREFVRASDMWLKERGLKKNGIDAAVEELCRQAKGVRDTDPEAVRLVARIVLQAIKDKSTDLHLEPMQDVLGVRYRVDGLLYEMVPLPKSAARSTIDAVKGWAGLDLGERHRSQDGRLLVQVEGRRIDIRASTCPGIHGEIVALRILDPLVAFPDLDHLGLEPEALERYRRIVQRPNGLIVVTGPTGCGKTATIYATLSVRNRPTTKIMTVEDPVEYAIAGINQSAVRPDIGMGFSQMLRSMLRQAPDILFVGEIRDLRAAEIICQAAMTGHLVFSVLHTNDAISAPIRLLDMGIAPFMVASSIQCVLAQRLVRRVCRNCKTRHEPTAEELDALGLEGEDRNGPFYHGAGCEQCNHIGYRGRVGIFQLLEFNRAVRNAVACGRLAHLSEAARGAGCVPMREAALAKLRRGETSVEEVIRQVCPAV